MEAATLEATTRDHVRQERSPAHPRAPARCPAVALRRRRQGRRRRSSVDPKALLAILHSESGVNTLISLKLAGAGRHAGAGQGLPARSDHARRCCTPTSTASRWTADQVTMPVIVKGEPKGVKQQGGVLEFVRREIEIECLPGDIPGAHRVDVSELMLRPGHPRARHRDQRRSGSRSAMPTRCSST